MIFKYFSIFLLLLLCLLYIKRISGSESCWNTKNECNIKTELFKNLEFSNGISMQIDCRHPLKFETNKSQDHLENNNNDNTVTDGDENYFHITTKQLLLARFMGVQAVMLDGCQTPLNANTYGLEFIPVCNNVTKVSIRHFHMDRLKPLHCMEAGQQQLEYLNIQFNEISIIEAESFLENQYPQLRDLLIEKNSLKVIDKNAFKAIRSLENLYIVNEPVLMLKFPDLFEYTSVVNIHLEALKQMTSDIFHHLPETLQNLFVANTPFDHNAVDVKNAFVLSNLTIKNCSLEIFSVQDVHSTVRRIDLSGNVMRTFTAQENNLTELNLSNNQLKTVPYEWLTNLTNLESLILKGNQIKTLSLDLLLKAVPKGLSFDFSQNHLETLQDYEKLVKDITFSQIRLRCDQNPWNCLWLHEFAHSHPEKFLILQYEKFISKINVNGLECVPAEKPPKPTNNSGSTPDKIFNISTYTLVYGSPWEVKRNQRAEALIIVFMLPLGIALLFLLLYMWIYCQKMFHLSYYKNFPCMRQQTNPSVQRFDVVRQLPLRPIQTIDNRTPLTRLQDNNDEGYEVPLNGIISECNCRLQQNQGPTKCQKTVHITYEQLPNEHPPQRIYEEIIDVDTLPDITDNIGNNTKPTYDHLTFK
ncbi:uncharacterized protein ACRADG_005380 [Cochliomyia hominivorax]